jgi:histidine kinase/DNA gyrase B/HSP90-like ATPase
MPSVTVRSHVGRDLIQSAQLFKTDKAVVWEYVANGLQYSAAGMPPRVVVKLDEKKKLIRIADNGRGMSLIDLEHFFTMHAENKDRASGRIGRGMFGTGKSAAFSIGSTLRITSIQHGKRTVTELTREEIDAIRTGEEIPVRILEAEVPTGEPNGTLVEIGQIHLKRIDRTGIIQYIERHLAHYPKDVEVIVDHHICEYRQPEVAEEVEFFPTGDDARILGNQRLQIRVARAPLDEESRGIVIFSHGNWHATTLAGADGKPMSEYIFGEIDVPNIEDHKSRTPAYDSSRSGILNPGNEVVAALYRFIGPSVEKVRRDLSARERERARTEEAKKLARNAARIAEILSSDFSAFQAKLAKVHSATKGRDLGSKLSGGGQEGERWIEGGDDLGERILKKRQTPTGPRNPGDGVAPEFPRPVVPKDDGETTGEKIGNGKNRRQTSQGGFQVEYQNSGDDERRGKYISDRRTIIINLDHPQVAAATKAFGIDDLVFVRLTIEIALAEYAVALAQELVDQYAVADEALFDIRDTIDRVSRKFASLYQR